MTKKWMLWLLLCGLLVAASAQAVTTQYPIEGYVFYPDGSPAVSVDVRVTDSANFDQATYFRSTFTDSNGHYFIPAGWGIPDDATVYFWYWTDTPAGGRHGRWGSTRDYYDKGPACQDRDQFGFCINRGWNLSATLFPSPYAPSAVYPAQGATGIDPTSITLRWNDGLDAERRVTAWSTTYDIFAAGAGGALTQIASDIPCNGVGTCSYTYPYPAQYGTYYDWVVTVKMHFPRCCAPLIHTSRGAFSFSTRTASGGTVTYSFRTYYSNYIKAENGGGGRVTATSNAIGAWEKFQIVDINGGLLLSGDSINLKASNGQYVVAENGGGIGSIVNANRDVAGSWERFQIVKANGGTGEITPGTAVALRSANGYYVVSEGGGGDVVNCDRSSIGPWETFYIGRQF